MNDLMMSAEARAEVQDTMEVIQEVAEELGWRPRRVLRRYRRGDERIRRLVHKEAELVGLKIDSNRFMEIIKYLLEIFKMLLPLFI